MTKYNPYTDFSPDKLMTLANAYNVVLGGVTANSDTSRFSMALDCEYSVASAEPSGKFSVSFRRIEDVLAAAWGKVGGTGDRANSAKILGELETQMAMALNRSICDGTAEVATVLKKFKPFAKRPKFQCAP